MMLPYVDTTIPDISQWLRSLPDRVSAPDVGVLTAAIRDYVVLYSKAEAVRTAWLGTTHEIESLQTMADALVGGFQLSANGWLIRKAGSRARRLAMTNGKEKRPLQRGIGGSGLHGATHTKQSTAQGVNTLSPDSDHRPPSVDGYFVPVARYWLDGSGTLSPYCICYDIRSESVHPYWLSVHIDTIPRCWLKGLPVVSHIDDDLLVDTMLVASLVRLRAFGWLEPMRNIIAWASERGHPQAKRWALVYAEEKLWGDV